MKIPELENGEKYVGLYVVDFGENTGVGFAAEEVAELLESEKFKDCRVYKIHRAYPDGKIELKGVRNQIFQLEMGMFFYSYNLAAAENDFKALVQLAEQAYPPGRAKVHLAKYANDKFVVALIYPAEYNDEFSGWLLDGDYKTLGPAEGGIEAVRRYYGDGPEILERQQLFGRSNYQSRTGQELLAATRMAVQR